MTKFHIKIRDSPPMMPMSFKRNFSNPTLKQVKVSLRILTKTKDNTLKQNQSIDSSNSHLKLDLWRKQLIVRADSYNKHMNTTSAFTFDSIYTDHDHQEDVCASILNSNDTLSFLSQNQNSCIITYGCNSSQTSIGSDDSVGSLGLIPLTICWIFKLMEEQKAKYATKYQIMMSILEIRKNHSFDLLNNENCQTDRISNSLKNISGSEKALIYLDEALGKRDSKSHLVFSILVESNGLEEATKGVFPSNYLKKICFVEFGNDEINEKNFKQLNFLLTSIINGEYLEKTILTGLLGEIFSTSNLKLGIVAHVSSDQNNYAETLDILRFTSSIQKLISNKELRMKLDKNTSIKSKNMTDYCPSITSTPSKIKLGSACQSNIKTEIWIDGPKLKPKVSPINRILTPGESINFNEIWIDGPNVAETKPKKNKAKSRHSVDQMQKLNSYFESIKDLRFDPTDSQECLDRALLKQINEQDADIIENFVFSGDCNSRPISLLSVNSSDTYSTATNSTTSSEFNRSESSYIKKLEDLKSSYDKMIFKQTFEPMESLHKTLESFLNLEQQNQRDLDSFDRPSRMTEDEKEKRLSRILSPTRLRSQNFQDFHVTVTKQQNSPSGSSSCSSNSTNSSITPPSSTPNSSFHQENIANRTDTKKRLFFNFNSRNGLLFQNCNSMPNSPIHNNVSSDIITNQSSNNDVIKSSKKQESILNRIFNRTKSRERFQNGMVYNNKAMRK